MGYKKDFDNWNEKKKRIERKSEIPYFKEREVWWCSLGVNVGHEEDGKNEKFERPVVILRKFNKHIFLAVPTTSRKRRGRYYYQIVYKNEQYTVILSQVRILSSKRLIRKISRPSKEDFNEIKKRVGEML